MCLDSAFLQIDNAFSVLCAFCTFIIFHHFFRFILGLVQLVSKRAQKQKWLHIVGVRLPHHVTKSHSERNINKYGGQLSKHTWLLISYGIQCFMVTFEIFIDETNEFWRCILIWNRASPRKFVRLRRKDAGKQEHCIIKHHWNVYTQKMGHAKKAT